MSIPPDANPSHEVQLLKTLKPRSVMQLKATKLAEQSLVNAHLKSNLPFKDSRRKKGEKIAKPKKID